MSLSFKPYKPRSIKFIELWQPSDWRIKIYFISAEEGIWNDRYQGIAKEIAATEINTISLAAGVHKVGFLTIHIAPIFNQIIFDYWAHENELRHLVFKADGCSPTSFTNITETGEAFCVWELKVISHERQSWINNVLLSQDCNFDSYLQDELNGSY